MAVEEILRVGNADNIVELITGWTFPEDTCVLLEQQPGQAVLTQKERQNLLICNFLHQTEKELLTQSTSGRIFQDDFELRWEKLETTYQVVYLGIPREITGLESDQTDLLAKLKQRKQSTCYLFGTKLDTSALRDPALQGKNGYFAEARIPRLLYYPVAPLKAMRLKIKVCEYIDQQTQEVQLFRFQGFEEAEL